MKKFATYTFILSMLLASAGCRSDHYGYESEPEPEPIVVEERPSGYLRIAVSTSGILPSRANPSGGEYGDGPEHGRGNENVIHDLCVFVYADGGEGLDGRYEFLWKKYATSQTIEDPDPAHPYDRIYNVSIPLVSDEVTELDAIKGKMRLAVIANAGDRTSDFANTRELVRDMTYSSAWMGETPATADWFLMSPAFNGAKCNNNDGALTKTQTEGETIFSGVVNLERVAARIDLQLSTSNIVADGDRRVIRYSVGGTDNYVTLTNAIPVNMMQNKSYLVKQVAADYASEWLSAGDETTDYRGIPTNYVISPNFIDKPNSNQTLTASWFGTSHTSWLRAAANRTALASISPLSPDVVSSAFQFEQAPDGQRAIVLTYANENTHSRDAQLTTVLNGQSIPASEHLSGLLFRAQYHPALLYSKGDLSETTEYVDGQSFWMFRTVEDQVKESKNLFFATRAAMNDYVATLPAGGRYETIYYPNGICYYNIWIKHANIDSDPEENFPMKYGIVRNNIYRISLNFEGIGQPTPELTEPYAVVSRIFVIKWNYRPQPEIIM